MSKAERVQCGVEPRERGLISEVPIDVPRSSWGAGSLEGVFLNSLPKPHSCSWLWCIKLR